MSGHCSLENSTCSANSFCNNGTCVCSKCFAGEKCDIPFSNLSLSLTNLMLVDTFTSQMIYLVLFIIMAIVGLLNNSLALITFIRERIRVTLCGVYLILNPERMSMEIGNCSSGVHALIGRFFSTNKKCIFCIVIDSKVLERDYPRSKILKSIF